MPYIGTSPSNGVRRVHTYTATASQTTFSGASSEGVTLSYSDTNYLDVFQNGVLLGSADYTSTSGTSVVLAQAASADDLVVIVVYDVFSVADTVSKSSGGSFDSAVTLSGGVSGNTTFSGEIITSTSGTSNVRIGENAGDAIASGGNNNTLVGDESGTAVTTGTRNTFTGTESGKTITTTFGNTFYGYRSGLNSTAQLGTFIGDNAGQNATGNNNTLIGQQAGYLITSGANNSVIGRFDGNQNGLDIRTANNRIVLSDGDGQVRNYVTNTGFTNISNDMNASSRFNSGGSTAHVVHRTGGDIVQFIENSHNANPYGLYIHFSAASPDNNGEYFLLCQDSTEARLIIRSDGDVQNHDNSYSAISDVKLKEQITNASSQWEDIKALTVRKYKMKTDVATGDSDAHWRLGVIAQEVETAGMGGLVSDNPDLDENNNDLGTTTKTVKYSILYMKAVKALQEAMARIETLEAKVTALENAE